MYNGYYYGFDMTYLVLVVPALLIALIAQIQVKSAFSRYARVRCTSGLTGAQAAQRILQANGITDVRIEHISGKLTDHFDPQAKVIRLSDEVYGVASIAAVGVAAHEAGHAVQYATDYAPIRIRAAIIPATRIGSNLSWPLLIAGLIFNWSVLVWAGILLFGLVTVFQLATLPVEFNASRRALAAIESRNLLTDDELRGARSVLRAAAMTYAAALQKHLTTWGFDVRCAEDFRNVLTECTAFDPQLVLLDITLPFYNGYHWCQELRRVSNVPVVFISSASDNMNIVMAMNMGGDDFIAKPFDLNVLLAKIQAILRRTYDFAAPAPTLEHRGAVLNTADASLMYQGQRIELTKNDYRILQTLLERKGSVVSRETLMEKLWETDSFVDENTLTVNIARLRRKLEAAGLSDYITTTKGLGYLIE